MYIRMIITIQYPLFREAFWHEYAKYMWIMKTILHYVYCEEIIVECLHSTVIFAIM